MSLNNGLDIETRTYEDGWYCVIGDMILISGTEEEIEDSRRLQEILVTLLTTDIPHLLEVCEKQRRLLQDVKTDHVFLGRCGWKTLEAISKHLEK